MKLFPCEDCQAVEQATWRGYAVSNLRGFQDSSGSNLVSGQCQSCFELEVGLETSCGAFQSNGYGDSVFAMYTWLCNHLRSYARTHLVFLLKNTKNLEPSLQTSIVKYNPLTYIVPE